MAVEKGAGLGDDARARAIDLLTTIIGLAELLRHGDPSAADWESRLQTIEAAARSLTYLLFEIGPNDPLPPSG